MSHRTLTVCILLGMLVGVFSSGGLSPSQTIKNTYFLGLCMHGDLIVSPSQQPPPQGNAPVQAPGASVYARQSDNSYVLQQHLGADIMVADCALSASQIVLTTFTQSTSASAKVYTLHFYDLVSQPGAATRQWKEGQTIVQTWESTGGIVVTTVDMTDEYLSLTSQYPNPINTGTVTIFTRASGPWMQTQQLSGKVDIFGSFPMLTASLHGQRLLVTALPGVASNSSAAINVYRANGGAFAFESEVGRECTWAVLGAEDTLAAATKFGVDLYKLGPEGSFALEDSLSAPAMAGELRGTKSLKVCV